MQQIRHQSSSSRGYPSNQGHPAGYPARHWSRAKKYLVIGGAVLALIMAGLFVLALKVALVLGGIILAAAILIGGYFYFQGKLD